MNRSTYFDHPGVLAEQDNKPKHIAIIMDGNGRWAKQQSFSRTKGHQKGVGSAKDVIMACCEWQIPILTLFAFGIENWKRPPKEIRNIFRILFLILKKDIHTLHEKNIQLRVIGDRSFYTPLLRKTIEEAEALTRQNTGLILNLAINFSGRWDLMQAISKLISQATSGELTPEMLNEGMISQAMSMQGLPEPDLFIRTGGVQRISNFILWELAYTELYFTDLLWPEFTTKDLEVALKAFSQRERRFGLTGDQLKS